jgi:hypothetical protein
LCLLFSQITLTVPFRLMILHLLQIFRTDALTFIVSSFARGPRYMKSIVTTSLPKFDSRLITSNDKLFVHESNRKGRVPPSPYLRGEF